ncbi:hypothetical protein LHJ74_26885 [Streptomyces sp. N2-109]|uniref:Hydrophobic protein n=1 Tax=Streptomyces gossypii TaxID=2883101 RepID=A0ABT2JZZ8_9ACTN|nr:hypothetical protein [Streptomyces gossypii]MCT2593489.1 hypothetical protein [Streptomyces gossypii]
MLLVLLLLFAAIVLGLVGWLAQGLAWLLVLGVLVLMADLVLFGALLGRGRGRRGRA